MVNHHQASIQGGVFFFNRFLSPAGIVNMSFPLSDQPVFGEWFIFVEVQGHTYNKSFEVQKYGEALHILKSCAQQLIVLFKTISTCDEYY